MRRLLGIAQKKATRLGAFLMAKKIPNPASTLMTTRFPERLLSRFFHSSDIPRYLEAGFSKLTTHCLYRPYCIQDFSAVTLELHKYGILKLYT